MASLKIVKLIIFAALADFSTVTGMRSEDEEDFLLGEGISGDANDTLEEAPRFSLVQKADLFKSLGVVGMKPKSDPVCGTKAREGVPVVVMLSGTGEGKSTTSCVLSRDPTVTKVAEDGKAHSETSTSCVLQTSWFVPYDHSEPLDIIDTPGFGDTRGQDIIDYNNDNIVETLKQAKNINTIVWVLNAMDTKLSESRQQAFKFVRSYFGKNVYKHLVFVYTRFAWKKQQGPVVRSGEVRNQALKKHHSAFMTALIDGVESEFWPDGVVDLDVKEKILGLPCFGIRTYVIDVDGDFLFADDDIDAEKYTTDDADGFSGVFNPESPGVTPNSATQLRDLKAQIMQISQGEPLNVETLRPFQTTCRATLQDSVKKTPPETFGQHVADCVEGQLHKVLQDEVLPYLEGMDDADAFAAFGVKDYTASLGNKGLQLRGDVLNALAINDSVRQTADAFDSYTSYAACRQAHSGNEPHVIVESLGSCLGGAVDRSTTAVREVLERMEHVPPALAKQLLAQVKKLPDQKRSIIDSLINFNKQVDREIHLDVEDVEGTKIFTARLFLSFPFTLAGMMEKAEANGILKIAKKQDWIEGQLTFSAKDGHDLLSDAGLNARLNEAAELLQLTATLHWKHGSPPKQLDPRFLEICLKHKDILAAEALVLDQVTSPRALVFSADPEQVLPHTQKHAAVLSAVLKLVKQEKVVVQEETASDRKGRMQERDERIKEIEHTREQLQPYLDEVESDRQSLVDSNGKLKEEVQNKVRDIMDSVTSATQLEMLKDVPEISTSQDLVNFISHLDQAGDELTRWIKDRPILSVADLILKSGVLNGITIGQDVQPVANELVQVIKVPALASIMKAAEGIGTGAEETSTRSAKTFNQAQKSLKKGDTSFAASLKMSGVGIGSFGIGAVSMAAQISNSMSNVQETDERSIGRSQSYYSMKMSTSPMKRIELKGSDLKLTSKFLDEVAGILKRSSSSWFQDVQALFNLWGTHFCPSVHMGGIWYATATFDMDETFSEIQAKEATSECLSAELSGGGGGFFASGFVKGSMATSASGCKATSSNDKSQTNKMMQHMRMARGCVADLPQGDCPSNAQTFNEALTVNSNWNVIDRQMGKCVAVWHELNQMSKAYDDELAKRIEGGKIENYSTIRDALNDLRDIMFKVWNLRVLGLPTLCSDVFGKNDEKCAKVKDAIIGGRLEDLKAITSHQIEALFMDVMEKSRQKHKQNEDCLALEWCHGADQGTCIQREHSTQMHCKCAATFEGDHCQKKIPMRKCTRWKDTYCTIHPVSHAPECHEAYGTGWKYGGWDHCDGNIFKVRRQCFKTWKCQPNTPGANCCGALEKGKYPERNGKERGFGTPDPE